MEKKSLTYEGEAILDMGQAKVSTGQIVRAWIEVGDTRVGDGSDIFLRTTAVGKSEAVQFLIVDETEKWMEIQKRLDSIEEGIILMHDKQGEIKKDVDRLKK